jgi:hypothetical protein
MAFHRDMSVDQQASLYATLGRHAIEHFKLSGEEEVLGVHIYHTKSNEAGQNTKFRMHIFAKNPQGLFLNISVFGALEFLDYKIKQIEGKKEAKSDPWKYDKISTHASLGECSEDVAGKIRMTVRNQGLTPDHQGDLSRRVADELASLLVEMPIAAHSLSEIPVIPSEGPRPIAALPPVMPARWEEGW